MFSLLSGPARMADRMASATRRTTGAALNTARATVVVGVGMAIVGAAAAAKITTSAAGKMGDAAGVGATGVSQAVAKTESVARQGLDIARALPRKAAWVGQVLTDLHERRHHRRAWAEHGHAYIEVRGLEGENVRTRELAAGVPKALSRLRGVRWAEVNAVTGQVLVAFDERRLGLERLLETVRAVEKAHGTQEEDFSWSRATHPGDSAAIAAAATELAADCVALTSAVAGKLLRLPALPHEARLAVALIEVEHGLRRWLKRRIGPIETDLMLSLVSAAAHGLSQGIASPAVDAVFRALLLAEVWERRKVWQRREAELCFHPESLPHEPRSRPPRPRHRPRGPVEKWSDRLGPIAPALAVIAFALTRSPGRAADAILAAAPKAAQYGRGGFASAAGWELARRGILPLDAAVFRRLDRISVIVIDSRTLCGDRPRVLTADAEPGVEVTRVWQAATDVLAGLSRNDVDGAGPLRHGGIRLERGSGPDRGRLVVHEHDRRLGRVTVRAELAPLAAAVLEAAGSTGSTVVLTDEPSVAELLPLLPHAAQIVDAEDSLAGHVRRFQEAGEDVLVVSAADEEALAAADAGVAMTNACGGACWSADVVCGGDLAGVWRVLRTAAAARGVSERAVRLAQAGFALAALLILVGGRHRPASFVLAPVHIAAAIAMTDGAIAGLRATRAALPPPSVHVP
ncbi:heavy-metal-associated domain-containing protein [Microbispora siamensis]